MYEGWKKRGFRFYIWGIDLDQERKSSQTEDILASRLRRQCEVQACNHKAEMMKWYILRSCSPLSYFYTLLHTSVVIQPSVLMETPWIGRHSVTGSLHTYTHTNTSTNHTPPMAIQRIQITYRVLPACLLLKIQTLELLAVNWQCLPLSHSAALNKITLLTVRCFSG